MKNKVISLILIIPLVLMFCVFSAANLATLKVPIAVNGVTIFHESQEIINLAETNEFQINAQVMPRNATNKALKYVPESVNGKNFPNLSIDENGLVKASGYGTAKITVSTIDGAYKKSFLLEVTSTLATDLNISLSEATEIFVGDEFVLNAKVVPNESLDKSVKFASSNTNVVRINELTGKCNAISSGRVTLTATLDNGLNGKIEKSIDVIVLPSASSSLITFNGKQNFSDKIFTDDYKDKLIIEVNFTSFHELGLTLNSNDIILQYDKSTIETVSPLTEIKDDNQNTEGIYKYKLDLEGLKGDFYLKASLNYEGYINYYSDITLEKVVDLEDIDINLNGFKDYIKKNETILFNVEVLPEDFTEYKINPYFTNNNSNNIQLWHISGNQFQIKGLEVGINTLNVEILVEEEIEVDGQIVVVDKVIKTFNKNIEVLNPPTTFNLFANSQKHGLEELLTIGNEEIVYEEEVVKEKYVVKNHTFNFTTNDVDLKYVEFSSSDESVAYFNKDKQLVILKEGKITITATELQSQLLGEPLISTLDLRCVLGVEVGNYKDLVKATKDDKQVVITNDIDLGEKLIDIDDNGVASIINGRTESECAQILSEEINQIETSSEWNYYKYNSDYNAKTPPLLNYIIKFTNNCYGNGYVLNANNITNFVKDISKGELFSFAKFRGPLDLVALPGASVKAQDNICFIASDNVMINNVELVGADMHGLDSNDLNELNYVGTVLEIMGDNVKVVNSRINNGRNCVRVFGKESGNEDKINVLIESCIISNAREFLVKMGTNTKMRGEFSQRDSINLANESLITNDIWEACAPKINGFRHLNDGTLTESEYNALVNEYKNSAEYQALIKTNLTIKNCVLQTSGLFSIGLESSFAGPALDGGRWNSYNFNEYGWKQIAGTSYPTQLNLEGTVKIYDWKNITHIDSSTLVEGGMFDFNLSKMIENIDNNNIISNIDGEKYVHGGVVMYGGGKNYALINLNLENIEPLKNYSLSLDSLNNSLTTILKKASGREDFRVLLYDNNSNFSYRQQVLELNSSNPYNIGKYII